MSFALPRTGELLEEGISFGDHFGAQVAVCLKGCEQSLVYGANAPFDPLEEDHLMLWLSATKPFAGVAIGILMDRGEIDLHDTVAQWIPAFGEKGKETITVYHLLTHTAGIRGGTVGWKARSWERCIETVCGTKPEPRWVPGEKAGYHVDSAWYMLAELVRVVDGRHYSRFVREEIFLPLDMPNCWIGMPDEVFDHYDDRIALMYDSTSGAPEISEPLCAREATTGCRPGGNGRGPAQEFLRFYQAMSCMVKGEAGILSVETAKALVHPHRVGMYDHTFKATMDWGLGFMLQSDQYQPGATPYQFGTGASKDAFGHCGNQSTAAFYDPRHDLSVVLLLNGMPGEERHQIRLRSILDALYADVLNS